MIVIKVNPKITAGAIFALVTTLSSHAASAQPAVRCASAGNTMERLICSNSSISARDRAMDRLYRAALVGPKASARRSQQRQWLASALTCRNASCLTESYDRRIGELLRSEAGIRIADKYYIKRAGATGDIIVMKQDGWLTYDAVETMVDPDNQATGRASVARLGGTMKFDGYFGREQLYYPVGCKVDLQFNRDRSWSMGTHSCFDDSKANLDENFQRLDKK